MARAFLRTVPAEPEESADFVAARERWQAASVRRRELVDRHAGAQAALGLLEREEDATAVPPRLAEAAERFLAGRVMSPRQLRRQLEELEDAIAAGAAVHAREANLWREAQSAEAARRVAGMRPRQRAVVARIAKAVEELSAAVEEERALHRELAQAGLAGHATLLPGSEGLGGSLHDYNSALSAWSRRVRQLGLLD